ncbi:MAG: DUF1269 domain-containing protein [Acetobacter sp.]|nr:DUF1269 domain-containing protein [Acetobacter sp.]
MLQNIVALSFPEENQARQALEALKAASEAGHLQLVNAAVISHDADDKFDVKDAWNNESSSGNILAGTVTGALIGLLAGPIGLLFGAVAGTMVGSAVSVGDVFTQKTLCEQFFHLVPVGTSATIALVNEYADEAVDDLAASLGATVIRRPAEAVAAEVAEQQQAQLQAAMAARKTLAEQHKEEWRDKLHHWHEDFEKKVDKMRTDIKFLTGMSHRD